jgi:hypothetical protein
MPTLTVRELIVWWVGCDHCPVVFVSFWLHSAGLPQENCSDALARCRFISGDWQAVDATVRKEGGTFDVILSSETVYSTESCPALARLIKSLLKPEGTAVLSNKRFYFGVGGGTRAFEAEAKKLVRPLAPLHALWHHVEQACDGASATCLPGCRVCCRAVCVVTCVCSTSPFPFCRAWSVRLSRYWKIEGPTFAKFVPCVTSCLSSRQQKAEARTQTHRHTDTQTHIQKLLHTRARAAGTTCR